MDGEGAGLRERSVQDRTESRELCKMDTHRSKRNFVLPPQPLDGGPAHPELERCLPKREVFHAFQLLFRDFHATARVGGGAELMKSVVSIIPVTGSPGPGPGLLERQRQAGGLPVVHSRWTAVSDSRSPEAWHRTLLEDLVASILLHCPKPKVRLFSPGCRLFLSLYGRDGFVKDGGVFLLSLTESTNCLVAENGWCLKRKRVTAVYVQHRTGMNRQTV